MSIFEYDEEKEKELLRKAEYENGMQQGLQMKIISLVCKKLEKGKSIEEIAEELEEDRAAIVKICEAVDAVGSGYDTEAVYAKLVKAQA